jgi:uncharacterized protein YbjT (DUF2867 family)
MMILVTGATGNVGSALVDELIGMGEKVRVFARDPRKVAHWGDGVEVAQGNFEDADSFGRAAAGAESAFLMNGAAEVGTFPQLIEAAEKVKLPRVVFLSSLFASLPGVQIGKVHAEKENAIRRSGIRGHFLRAGGFMSNTLQWAPSIKAQGVVYNPTSTGKIAAIAPEDIAAVAAKLLVRPNGAEEAPELTGDALLSVPEQVEILSKAIGKPVRSVDVPPEAAVEGMKRNGLPAQLAEAVGESIAVVREGRAEHVTDWVQRITGRKPMSFAQWAEKHAEKFR